MSKFLLTFGTPGMILVRICGWPRRFPFFLGQESTGIWSISTTHRSHAALSVEELGRERVSLHKSALTFAARLQNSTRCLLLDGSNRYGLLRWIFRIDEGACKPFKVIFRLRRGGNQFQVARRKYLIEQICELTCFRCDGDGELLESHISEIANLNCDWKRREVGLEARDRRV